MLSPTFFHDVIAQTPVKVIAQAGSVAVLVQLVKTIAPKLVTGNVAILLNLAVSMAAVFVGMDPAHFWSETTLAQVLTVAAGAAGVHGTARSWGWTGKGQDTPPGPPGPPLPPPSDTPRSFNTTPLPPANGGPA